MAGVGFFGEFSNDQSIKVLVKSLSWTLIFSGALLLRRFFYKTKRLKIKKMRRCAAFLGLRQIMKLKKRARFFQNFLFFFFPTPQKNQAPGLKCYVYTHNPAKSKVQFMWCKRWKGGGWVARWNSFFRVDKKVFKNIQMGANSNGRRGARGVFTPTLNFKYWNLNFKP